MSVLPLGDGGEVMPQSCGSSFSEDPLVNAVASLKPSEVWYCGPRPSQSMVLTPSTQMSPSISNPPTTLPGPSLRQFTVSAAAAAAANALNFALSDGTALPTLAAALP